jgi:hypothetical protein
MKRREFVAGLGSAAVWPLAARAQQAAMPMVGILSTQSAEVDYNDVTVPILQGLKEIGFVEGQNVAVEYRYAENQYDRLPALAADLVRRRVDVIIASANEAAAAAKAATTTVPIVIGVGGDPVAMGLVASLNRPGANVTGIANLNAELAPKRLQLLREVTPNATRFGILADSGSRPLQPRLPDFGSIWLTEEHARTTGVDTHRARDPFAGAIPHSVAVAISTTRLVCSVISPPSPATPWPCPVNQMPQTTEGHAVPKDASALGGLAGKPTATPPETSEARTTHQRAPRLRRRHRR